MDLNSAITTAFTFLLLFAGAATARISFYPSPADLPLLPKPLPEPQPAAGDSKSNIVLPTEISKSQSESEKENSRMFFGVDLTPRTDFANLARFHAINRHFFDEPRVPVRSVHRHNTHRHSVDPFAVPRSEIVKFSGEIGNFDAESFHRRAPAKTMKVKHDYHHRNHHGNHHNHHQHLHLHRNNDGSVPKHVEKVKSEQHVEKSINREVHHEAGFMNQFRKFLKHTFD